MHILGHQSHHYPHHTHRDRAAKRIWSVHRDSSAAYPLAGVPFTTHGGQERHSVIKAFDRHQCFEQLRRCRMATPHTHTHRHAHTTRNPTRSTDWSAICCNQRRAFGGVGETTTPPKEGRGGRAHRRPTTYRCRPTVAVRQPALHRRLHRGPSRLEEESLACHQDPRPKGQLGQPWKQTLPPAYRISSASVIRYRAVVLSGGAFRRT